MLWNCLLILHWNWNTVIKLIPLFCTVTEFVTLLLEALFVFSDHLTLLIIPSEWSHTLYNYPLQLSLYTTSFCKLGKIPDEWAEQIRIHNVVWFAKQPSCVACTYQLWDVEFLYTWTPICELRCDTDLVIFPLDVARRHVISTMAHDYLLLNTSCEQFNTEENTAFVVYQISMIYINKFAIQNWVLA